MEWAEKILNRFTISNPQRKFLLTLFVALLTTRGKINFRNIARFPDKSEETYSRQYSKSFAFIAFNREVIDEAFGESSERIIAYDPSFITKSGKKTYGLDYFWNGCHGRSEKGLEIATLAIVDIKKNTGLALSTRQTEPVEPTAPPSNRAPRKKTHQKKSGKKKGNAQPPQSGRTDKKEDETLIDQYVQQLREAKPFLREGETHLVVDGAFAKKKYVDGVCELGLHVVGKLRRDANMRYLYTGPKRKKGRGRQS